MTQSTERRNRILRTIGSLVFWLGVWYGLAWYVGRELVLPSPTAVIKTLAELAVTASFWVSAAMSLLRIFCGYAAGVFSGIILALLSAGSRLLDALISPVMRVVRATPVASFIILALLWLGKGRVPTFISALMVTPVVYGSLLTALRNTDERYLEMARAYCFSRKQILSLIYVPSVMPALSGSCITSLGLAWKAGIAAEILCLAKNAIGSELYYSKIYLETPALFAWTAVVVLLSFILEKLIGMLLISAKRRMKR